MSQNSIVVELEHNLAELMSNCCREEGSKYTVHDSRNIAPMGPSVANRESKESAVGEHENEHFDLQGQSGSRKRHPKTFNDRRHSKKLKHLSSAYQTDSEADNDNTTKLVELARLREKYKHITPPGMIFNPIKYI